MIDLYLLLVVDISDSITHQAARTDDLKICRDLYTFDKSIPYTVRNALSVIEGEKEGKNYEKEIYWLFIMFKIYHCTVAMYLGNCQVSYVDRRCLHISMQKKKKNTGAKRSFYVGSIDLSIVGSNLAVYFLSIVHACVC